MVGPCDVKRMIYDDPLTRWYYPACLALMSSKHVDKRGIQNIRISEVRITPPHLHQSGNYCTSAKGFPKRAFFLDQHAAQWGRPFSLSAYISSKFVHTGYLGLVFFHKISPPPRSPSPSRSPPPPPRSSPYRSNFAVVGAPPARLIHE